MVFQRLLTILLLVATLVDGQAIADEISTEEVTSDVTTNNTTVEEVVQQISPDYAPEDCNYWLSTLVAADIDQSDGLSEAEYHAFLSSIDDPPYISEYFTNYPTFEKLPWPFRIVHKSLSCHCEKLGYGKNCCKGDDAELLLQGLDGENSNDPATALLEMEYKDLACQQISYVLERNIDSPAPTDSPTESPSKSPSSSPTVSPSRNPTATPTASPSLAPVIVTPAPTGAPSESLAPSADLVIAPIEEQEGGTDETQDEGLGTGGIIGIIVAILLALLAIIALVAYRRKMEQDRLNKFAGEAAPEADLEAPLPAEEAVPEPEPEANPEPEPTPEPDEDDESSAPSVWSEGEEDDKNAGEIVEGEDGPVAVTAGSALAAMGAASTVATNLMTTPSNKR